MKPKFYLRDEAISLRRRGYSYPMIEKRLAVPRATLSNWFRGLILRVAARQQIQNRKAKHLVHARSLANSWHKEAKQQRFLDAEFAASSLLKAMDTKDMRILEVAAALLYIGEGSKKNEETALGSTDPQILKFFLTVLRKIYHLETSKIRCELYLRADQNPNAMKRYWSKTLGLPLSAFRQVNFDLRTTGSKTYPHYKGVCNIRCAAVAIQRKLLATARQYMTTISAGL